MSGGSFNYICGVMACDILYRIDDLKDIVEFMEKEFPGITPTADAKRLLTMVQEFERSYEKLSEQLYGVFHSIEWWQSFDISRDDVVDEINKYREANHD